MAYSDMGDVKGSSIADDIQKLSEINASLEKGITSLGGPRDTETFRKKLHETLSSGTTLSASLGKRMKSIKAPAKVVQRFAKEVKQFQQLGERLSAAERSVIKRLSNPEGSAARLSAGGKKTQAFDDPGVSLIQLDSEAADLESREIALKNVLTEVTQINDMMKDLAYLVEEQQDGINAIEDNVTSANIHIKKGETELQTVWLGLLFSNCVGFQVARKEQKQTVLDSLDCSDSDSRARARLVLWIGLGYTTRSLNQMVQLLGVIHFCEVLPFSFLVQ